MDETPKSNTKWKLSLKSSELEFIKQSSCTANDDVKDLKPWEVSNDGTIRSALVYIPPELCTYLISSSNIEGETQRPLRVLLAIHGYGGQPMHEIKKWHDAATSLQSIIISPQGTPTESNGRLGWNAIDCCGDPVTKNVDDLSFLYGLVDTVLHTILMDDMKRSDHVNIIATGFSNGGFMSSLLGLQTERLSSLVGIVPTGGYQYDLKLYDNLQNEALHLPVFAHHGGKDGVVKPDGCCDSGNSESNCPLDIGINESTCTSIRTAFEKWSQINQCKSTSIDDASTTQEGDRRLADSSNSHTCWKGNDCQASTELCIWTNAGHNWGWEFPGTVLAKTWMENVFTAAETTSARIPTSTSSDEYDDIQIYVLIASLGIFCLMVIRFMIIRYRSRAVFVKRKSSEDNVVSIQIM